MYIFDKEKRNWTERGVTDIILEVTTKGDKTRSVKTGRGQLRLNDSAVSKPGHLRSRLVVGVFLFADQLSQHWSLTIKLVKIASAGEDVW